MARSFLSSILRHGQRRPLGALLRMKPYIAGRRTQQAGLEARPGRHTGRTRNRAIAFLTPAATLLVCAECQIVAVAMSEKFANRNFMPALVSKADMCGATRDVRYGPKADNHDSTSDLNGPPQKLDLSPTRSFAQLRQRITQFERPVKSRARASRPASMLRTRC